MKKILVYAICIAMAITSCSKKNNDKESTNQLTGIQIGDKLAELYYDSEQRLVKINYRMHKNNSYEPPYQSAILSYGPNKAEKVEYLHRSITSGELQLKYVSTLTYNEAGKPLQRVKNLPDGTIVEALTCLYDKNTGRLARHSLDRGYIYVKSYNLDDQGNLSPQNYNDGTSSGTYEYVYDSEKSVMGKNELGEFLYFADLLPDMNTNPALLFSKNNIVKIHYVTVTGNKKTDRLTKYTNNYYQDGKLKSFSYQMREDHYTNDVITETFTGQETGAYYFDKYF